MSGQQIKFKPGDVELIAVDITSSSASVGTKSLIGQIVSIDIFEDINECSMHAEISIVDALGLINALPIIGQEKIYIEFKTMFPSANKDDDGVLRFKFFCYQVSPVADVTTRSSQYTLYCTTEEHITNATRVIDKSYKNTIDSMVEDLIKGEIKSTKKVTKDKTRGIIPLVIPRLTPFTAVDFLRQRAVGMESTGGVFVFFENKDGYNFRTLESLVSNSQETSKLQFPFLVVPAANANKPSEIMQFVSIISHRYLSKFDTYTPIFDGMYKTQTRSFDLLTGKVSDIDFKYSEYKSQFANAEKNTSPPLTSKFIKEVEAGDPNYFFTPRDRSRPDDFFHMVAGQKQAYLNLFNSNIVRIHTYGNSTLTVGNGVELFLPPLQGATDSDTRNEFDQQHSGVYVVTKLRRTISPQGTNFKYLMTFDANRTGRKSVR